MSEHARARWSTSSHCTVHHTDIIYLPIMIERSLRTHIGGRLSYYQYPLPVSLKCLHVHGRGGNSNICRSVSQYRKFLCNKNRNMGSTMFIPLNSSSTRVCTHGIVNDPAIVCVGKWCALWERERQAWGVLLLDLRKAPWENMQVFAIIDHKNTFLLYLISFIFLIIFFKYISVLQPR